MSRVKAAVTFAIVIFLLISFATYQASDPTLNQASNDLVENFAGILGAYTTDLLLQFFGLAAYGLIFTLSFWGYFLYQHQKINLIYLKSLSLLVALTGLSYGMAAFKIGLFNYYPGGAVGYLFLRLVNQFCMANQLDITIVKYSVLFGSLILLIYSASISLANLRDLFSKISQTILNFLRKLWNKQIEQNYDNKHHQEHYLTNLIEAKNEVSVNKNSPKFDNPAKKLIKSAGQNFMQANLKDSNNGFILPSTSLLKDYPVNKDAFTQNNVLIKKNTEELKKVLEDFGVMGDILGGTSGPVVTLYEFEPAAGTKSSRVIGLSDDISRSMRATAARIAVIPGRNAIGIELPNKQRETVYLKELLESSDYRNKKYDLPIILGKDIEGNVEVVDLARMPHLLVAGTTGSGKSVAINTMILSLIYSLTPEQCKFIMIDPKMLELSVYDGIPHLLTNVVTEPAKAIIALKWVVKEMENRYRLMSNLSVRNIHSYNERIGDALGKGEIIKRTVQTGFNSDTGQLMIEQVPLDMKTLPFIVVIVDEMADLMLVAGKEIEISIQRLAQMARAAGIHIIMATQRPSVDVITGVIKANFPTRISFQVTSKIDSRTILGEQGAEQLLGKGDMLYMAGGSKITRIHGPFVADHEVENIVSFLKEQGPAQYLADVTIDDDSQSSIGNLGGSSDEGDELYRQAVEIVKTEGKASTSFIQRCLKIGYNRAANIIEQMEKEGLVSKPNHVGKREILY